MTEQTLQLQFAFQLLMVICYGFLKISIVYFYRRIFVTAKRGLFDIITTAVNVVLFLWSITFILIIIFPCGKHIYANWGTPASQLAYCEKIGHTSEEGLTASDLILDVVLLVLPVPSVSICTSRDLSLAIDSLFADLGSAYVDYKEDPSHIHHDAWPIVRHPYCFLSPKLIVVTVPSLPRSLAWSYTSN